MSESELIEKIKKIPFVYQQQISDFIDFLLENRINNSSSNIDRSALLGSFRDKIKIHDNFDDPIEGMAEYM